MTATGLIEGGGSMVSALSEAFFAGSRAMLAGAIVGNWPAASMAQPIGREAVTTVRGMSSLLERNASRTTSPLTGPLALCGRTTPNLGSEIRAVPSPARDHA